MFFEGFADELIKLAIPKGYAMRTIGKAERAARGVSAKREAVKKIRSAESKIREGQRERTRSVVGDLPPMSKHLIERLNMLSGVSG